MTTNTDNNVPLIGREEPSELMHYTNASGLKGILESQSLWATNALFLNDSEEIKLFLDERLRDLVSRAFNKACLLAKERTLTEDSVIVVFRQLMLELAHPYILSMCRPPKDDPIWQNGLLSQWRGYGCDGGYALVFDYEKLIDCFRGEYKTYHYQYVEWDSVYYHDKNISSTKLLQRVGIVDLETTFIDKLLIMLEKQKPDSIVNMEIVSLLTKLSCLYKHIGFQEEQEFRVFVMPTNSKLRDLVDNFDEEERVSVEKDLARRIKKSHKIFIRDGCPIPYIELLAQPPNTQNHVGLPIKRIIVGPHRNKLQRKLGVELMLSELGISAEVVVSDIPYIGS